MLKNKPQIGDKVITGNPDCCWSGHKEGLLGVVVEVDSLKDWGAKVKVGKRIWWQCKKCMSVPPNKASTRRLAGGRSNRTSSAASRR